MCIKIVLYFLFLSTLLFQKLFTAIPQSKKDDNQMCGEGPYSMRVTMRHIEGNGIGYRTGYTTLETFFAPSEPWGEGSYFPENCEIWDSRDG